MVMEKLLRREEVAEMFKCSPAHVSNITKRGLLKAVSLGKCVRYREADIKEMVQNNMIHNAERV